MSCRAVLIKYGFIIALTGTAFLCDKNPVEPDPSSVPYAIYLLDDPEFDPEKVFNEDYSDFEIKGHPWLTDEDIEFYDWSNHCIFLKENKLTLFPKYDFKYFVEEFINKMFIVAVNGEICYPAQCNYNAFSPIPELGLIGIFLTPDDVLWIEWYYPFAWDRRNDVRVKQVLIEKGLFHAGLEVHLDELDAITIIENADTSTIEYTFTLSNKDEDNLYVFDPDIVGNSFHWYTNGPVFIRVGESGLYESTYKELDPREDWNPSWYVKLESGASLTRTVSLKGYPYFPPGEYAVRFPHSGPRVYKDLRYTEDGRYWTGGDVLSNYSFVYIDENGEQTVARRLLSVADQDFLRAQKPLEHSVK
ncbi:hypothetical protein ACFL45_07860 [Candidatus Neomarinimicrobiota bacterium]